MQLLVATRKRVTVMSLPCVKGCFFYLPEGIGLISPNIFTNRQKCDILIVPDNLNIHSYRSFLLLWDNYSFFRYTIKQTRFGKNATPA